MATSNDLHKLATLASAVKADNGDALYAHALAFGAGESTVDSQHSVAIANLTALQSAGFGSAAVTQALLVLAAKQGHLRSPNTVNDPYQNHA